VPPPNRKEAMERRHLLKATGLAAIAAGPALAAGPELGADAAGRDEGGTREMASSNTSGLPGQFARSARHASFYLDAGPKSGPAVILIHGWPEIALAWRHQIEALPRLGFRVVAPDLRGCGQSAAYDAYAAYAQREIVRDMIELADALDIKRAVWVGHDWGAAVAWNIARHHPDRCHAVAALCVPYDTLERGVDRLTPLVNRKIYPAAEFPAGQFEYVEFYHEHFDEARRSFEANVGSLFKVIMRRGDPEQAGKPFPTAFVRKQGGWFGPGRPAPDVPLDPAILDDADLASYVQAYQRTGFFGVNALYMNDADNDRYAQEARADAIEMPALFLSGQNDFVNDTEYSDLAGPMRAKCRNLTYKTIGSGHWMQHERPGEVNAALCGWIASKVPAAWPS